ncbi:hypothetical protein [Anaerobutyricum hallii]|uniref:hypothetical protein n=1 Tax=Anaerobutyricum hallii TaxID=39488 RepID=UPI00352186C6
MKQNLSTAKRSIFCLAFCFSLLFCFGCIGRFSTVGNAVAASQHKVTVKTRAAAEINKRVTCTKRVAAIGGVTSGSTTIQGNQTPELPDYEDPVMQTVIDEEETPL